MLESSPPNVPIYLDSFLLFLVAGWIVRTIVLPYKIARRAGKKFRYGHIAPEDRQTLTAGERSLLTAQKTLAIAGLLGFALSVLWLFRSAG